MKTISAATRLVVVLLSILSGASLAAWTGSANADALSDLLAAEPAAEEAPAKGEGTIAADSSPASDAGIRRRLRGIYAELEALDGIEPSVASGIVTLRGTAGSTPSAERALEIAAQVEGVVDVVDEMTVDTNVARRLGTTMERLRATTLGAIAALPILLLAFGVIALFWWLGRWVARREKVFGAIAPNGFIAQLLGGIARIVVVMVGLFLALSLLDATSIIGTVLGAAGIVGLAVGFAVRDTVENWIASVLLSLRTPFVARDYVQIGEHEGAVARLTSRATVLISLDGNHIRIPNATVFKSVIVNYSSNHERRFEFAVGVDTDLDLADAQRTALEAMSEVPGVLEDPPVSVVVEALGDSSVTLSVLAWIDQRTSDIRKVRSEAIRFVKQSFDAAGIVMPEPIYRVKIDASAGAAVRGPQALAGEGGTNDGAGVDTGDATVSGADGEEQARAPADVPSMRPRLRACDAADTSIDSGVEATLEREIGKAGEENLLDADASRE